MISFFKKLFGSKPAETTTEVPYKVEAVAPAVTPVAEQATEAAVKSVAKPAPKKQGAKPAAKKQGGQKPKGPRKPKAKPAQQ